MTIVTLVRANDCPSRDLSGAMIHDVLWAFARPESGLEHVRVSAHIDRIDIAMFCLAKTALEAHAAAVSVCDRACHGSPKLYGWHVQE